MNVEPRRRLFRFSLRTLLLFVTITSVGFGYLAVKVRQAERQRAAVGAIRKAGGLIYYDYQMVAVGKAIGSPKPPGPAWLRKCFGIDFLADVKHVHIVSGLTSGPNQPVSVNFTDAELVHLQELAKLEGLGLGYTDVTDAGLVHLQGLTQLKDLDLGATRTTDQGCQKLQEALPNLRIQR